MRRLTISLDDDLADTFDQVVKDRGYKNRSEAFRDLLRGELRKETLEAGLGKHCVGTLSYVYNHHQRQLAGRLTGMQHEHHDVTVATMHAHLDHDNCIETVIVRGATEAVVKFAQSVMAQTGVRHGRFYPIPVEVENADPKGHIHARPRT